MTQSRSPSRLASFGNASLVARLLGGALIGILFVSCSSGKGNSNVSVTPAPPLAVVSATVASTCGSIRGVQTQIASIRLTLVASNADSVNRVALRAKLVAQLGGAEANARAGSAYLRQISFDLSAQEYANRIETALDRVALNYRRYREQAAGFTIVDRDNWEDDLHSWQRNSYRGDGDAELQILKDATSFGKFGAAVATAAKAAAACKSVAV